MREIIIQVNAHNPIFPKIRAIVKDGRVIYETRKTRKRAYSPDGKRPYIPGYTVLEERDLLPNETDYDIKMYYLNNLTLKHRG